MKKRKLESRDVAPRWETLSVRPVTTVTDMWSVLLSQSFSENASSAEALPPAVAPVGH